MTMILELELDWIYQGVMVMEMEMGMDRMMVMVGRLIEIVELSWRSKLVRNITEICTKIFIKNNCSISLINI